MNARCGSRGQKLPEADDHPESELPLPQSEPPEPQSEPPPEAKDQPEPEDRDPLRKGSKSSSS